MAPEQQEQPQASAVATARVAQAKLRDAEDRNTVLQAMVLDAQDTIGSMIVEVRILRRRLGLPMIGEPDYTDEEIEAAEKAVAPPRAVTDAVARRTVAKKAAAKKTAAKKTTRNKAGSK